MNPANLSRKYLGALLALGLLTSIAFAIAGTLVSSVARAASPPQCPTGTTLNAQTHACVAVKPPTPAAPAAKPAIAPAPTVNPAAAPAPAAKPAVIVPPPAPIALKPPTNTATCTLPTSTPCSASAASCQTQTVCCSTPQGTQKCAQVQNSKPASCLLGYYGASCNACPGGASNPCSGNGSCSQGIGGNGTCTCAAGFSGAYCQTAVSQ
jgi:hypothetical protein